jgi:hypothetical protein
MLWHLARKSINRGDAFLFEEEACCPLLEPIAHHAGVGAVGRSKSIIHVHVSQLPAEIRTVPKASFTCTSASFLQK